MTLIPVSLFLSRKMAYPTVKMSASKLAAMRAEDDLKRQEASEKIATDESSLLQMTDVLRCTGCGCALTDVHKYPVYSSQANSKVTRAFVQYPIAYDQKKANPWTFTDNSFHSGECVLGWDFDMELGNTSLISMMMINLHKQPPIAMQRSAPYEVLQRANQGVAAPFLPGRSAPVKGHPFGPVAAPPPGITAQQMAALRRFPMFQLKWAMHPEAVPKMPGEQEALNQNNPAFTKGYRTLEITELIHKQARTSATLSKEDAQAALSVPNHFFSDNVGQLSLDSDPDSDDDN